MKRRELLRHLAAHGCELAPEGGPHSLWINATRTALQPIPRHVEIPDGLARRICRMLGVPEVGR